MQNFLFRRIDNNSAKSSVIIFLLLLPSLELIWYVNYILGGGVAYDPDMAFFLRGNSVGIGHVLQGLFFWMMPIYCLLLVAEDCIEDRRIGYMNVVMGRVGKKNYIKQHLIKSFVVMFLISGFALVLNLICTNLLLSGGVFSPQENGQINSFAIFWAENAVLNNFLHIFLASITYGVMGMFSCVTALNFCNRRTVYFICIMFWFVELLKPNAVTQLFQPFGIFSTLSGFILNIFEFIVPASIYICVLTWRVVHCE